MGRVAAAARVELPHRSFAIRHGRLACGVHAAVAARRGGASLCEADVHQARARRPPARDLGAVRRGELKANSVPERLNTLLHYVRVTNCKYEHERDRVERTVLNSEEWVVLLRRLLECEDEHAEGDKVEGEGTDQIVSAKVRIASFIQAMRNEGYEITKTQIWRAAGYNNATEFERFQRDDERTTASARDNFNRILAMSPDLFINLLRKKNLL